MKRRTAITAGVLYLITHVTSIAAVVLYGGLLDDPLGPGSDTRVLVGGLCDVLLALSVVGTAVALYPVVKRHGEGLAIGYVGLRTLEAAVIVAGVVALLAVVTLRQSGAATEPVAEGLVAVRDWTFLVGPGLVCGTNTVVLAALMYRSRLVPRFIAVLGLVGGPLVFGWNLMSMFGGTELFSAVAVLFVAPVFAWEICLAVYLIAKGFRPTVVPAPVVDREPVAVG
ncbi:DUF4386 domain-containing protein [Petropleomorpha daqingensis]|uniref:DUF4386 domain-containing protein n=1 Tax=Petropleomorpha daqingensis TaxID=2026353 RepID=A0A853CGR8_9ACTN|nr:DUF4386 domain-containing protein [Petropleomorpha daqingensis]NYJ06647.1 hypothetical protein [Petropleomorpha daqingensis]